MILVQMRIPYPGSDKIDPFGSPGSEALDNSKSSFFYCPDLINFQYYIEVVPTVVDTYLGSKVTYQYSVKVIMKI